MPSSSIVLPLNSSKFGPKYCRIYKFIYVMYIYKIYIIGIYKIYTHRKALFYCNYSVYFKCLSLTKNISLIIVSKYTYHKFYRSLSYTYLEEKNFCILYKNIIKPYQREKVGSISCNNHITVSFSFNILD